MFERDRRSATAITADGNPRYIWEPLDPAETELPTYRQAVLAAIEERRRWREEYEAAKQQVDKATTDHSATARPGGEAASATDHASATVLLRPPRIAGRTEVVGLVVKGERRESRSDTEGALDDQGGDLIIQQAGEDEAPATESRRFERWNA